jgi:hypothetical protein
VLTEFEQFAAPFDAWVGRTSNGFQFDFTIVPISLGRRIRRAQKPELIAHKANLLP